jgi:DNA repair ATPase RecN
MTTQETTQTEESAFLQNQRRVMAQKEQLDRDIAERTRYTLQPAVTENEKPFNSKEAYVIESFDAANNKTERRTITPLPQPAQRFQKPETPTLPELRQAINDLVADIEGAGADYETVATNLDSFYAPHKALEKRISELKAALSQAETELAELRAEGSPAEGYKRFIVGAEQKVNGIARQLVDRFSADKAREKFDTEFHRLSPATQNDLQISIRLKLERFANQFYPRLGQRNLNATIDQVKARASELLRDLRTILTENFSK